MPDCVGLVRYRISSGIPVPDWLDTGKSGILAVYKSSNLSMSLSISLFLFMSMFMFMFTFTTNRLNLFMLMDTDRDSGQNVMWTKRPEGQNVLRDKTSLGLNILWTKRPQGQNVLRKNILIHWKKAYITMKKCPTTMKKSEEYWDFSRKLGTVKHISCYISVSLIDIYGDFKLFWSPGKWDYS